MPVLKCLPLILSVFSILYLAGTKTSQTVCPAVDTSRTAVAYIFLPHRFASRSESTVFKFHHFYSLLLLVNTFKLSSNNKLLFYYLSNRKPTSTHYHQWLSDPFWTNKINLTNVEFIPINNKNSKNSKNSNNMYEIFTHIQQDISVRLTNQSSTTHVLITTSDVLIGPRLITCLISPDQIFEPVQNNTQLHLKLTSDCSITLNSTGFISFLFQMHGIHDPADFSGLYLWKRDKQNTFQPNQVSAFNAYKCHHKSDIDTHFSDSFCTSGFDINTSDEPTLESLFFVNTYFSRLIRKYIYDNSEILNYKKFNKFPTNEQTNEPIPNIVHLIWFSDIPRPLKLIEYLSLMSISRILRPDTIQIHGDIQPVGHYWNSILNSTDTPIIWIHKQRTTTKFNQDLSNAPIQHLADIARLDVLYEQGGIYSDWDIIWAKSIDQLRYTNADVIASNDITSYCKEFPNSIQIGAFMSKPKSTFVKSWLEGYKDYNLYPGDYAAVSMCQPYKLYEKQPHKLLVENRLQMIYFNGWSSFIPRYLDLSQEQLTKFNENLDWLNNGTFAYHLPKHSDLFNMDSFNKADKRHLPIRIAQFIMDLI